MDKIDRYLYTTETQQGMKGSIIRGMYHAMIAAVDDVSVNSLRAKNFSRNVNMNFIGRTRRRSTAAFKSMCNVLKKTFLKTLSISNEILSKFGIHGTPDYQRVT